MRKTILLPLLLLAVTAVSAQEADRIFQGYLYNEEFQVWLDLNLYEQDVLVKGQESIMGQVPGYLGAKRDDRKWIIVDAALNGSVARLDIVNDYGSEDLTATLTYTPVDDTFWLEQKSGSTIKIAVNRKWVKLPKKLKFSKQQQP